MNLSKRVPYKWTKHKLHILKRLKKSNASQHSGIYVQSVISRWAGNTPLFGGPHLFPRLRTDMDQYHTKGNWIVYSSKKKSCLILAYDLTILPSSKTHTNVNWGKVILEHRWLKVDLTYFQTGSYAWDSFFVPWWGSLFFLSFHPGLTSVLCLITASHSFLSSIHLLYRIMSSLRAAAAAKSLQSCPTLCDPIDGSPPGSPVPGILWGQEHTFLFPASSTVLSK